MRIAIAGTFFCAMAAMAVPAAASSFDYFIGTWTCHTDAGSTAKHIYRQALDGQWLALENMYVTKAGLSGAFIEYYRFDSTIKKWTVSSMGANGTLFVGNAPDWTADRLTFDGTTDGGDALVKTREIYTRTGNDSFEREHDAATKDGWQRSSHEVCTRI